MFVWKERLRASGVHLGASLLAAGAAAWLVFSLWYPYPYREISGGRDLFLILVSVDVVLGPLITFAIFNRGKPPAELRRDLAVVVAIQLAALGYGLWTVSIARPVHLAFEIDRFRVIHAVDVPEELLSHTPPGIEAQPWTGPTLVAVRPFANHQESADATMAAVQGIHIGARPDFWQPYPQSRQAVLEAAKPVAQLRKRMGEAGPEFERTLRARTGRDPAQLAYVPLVARKAFWTAVIDPVTADVLGFYPYDPF